MTTELPDFPDSLESERLIIRAPRVGDGVKVFEAVVESLDELRKFPASLPWAVAEPAVEASELFCAIGAENFQARRDLPMLLFLRDSGVLVGCGGLHQPKWDARTFEIGWWGRTPFTGRGLISEAVESILDFAFSSLAANRVEAITDDLNVRAWKLCERVGMSLEGVRRNERGNSSHGLWNSRIYSRIS